MNHDDCMALVLSGCCCTGLSSDEAVGQRKIQRKRKIQIQGDLQYDSSSEAALDSEEEHGLEADGVDILCCGASYDAFNVDTDLVKN